MEITIHNTDKIVTLNGVPARIWEGQTKSGIAVHCYVTRIAAPIEADCAEFERELKETPAPCTVQAVPLAMII